MANDHTRSTLQVSGTAHTYYAFSKLGEAQKIARLPFALKILLENLIRNQDNNTVQDKDIAALVNWNAKAKPTHEIAFRPARVILQDFTGVPAVVDLAAMREAMTALGGDANKINPLSPVDLVIDHSVMVDHFAHANALAENTKIEFERNKERYTFLRWGQTAFEQFRVVPPGTGIVHQVNLEYLAQVIFKNTQADTPCLYPDTVVGTDSHTTMINGLGVLGWGVGGIEAEAAMLGQPITMLIPQVIGFELTGELSEGATATDLVLRVVEMLRQRGVVGKFVEFYGDGLDNLPLADRATIANMAPEYGATCGLFPIDNETLNFMALSGRDAADIAAVEAYAKAQGFFREKGQAPAEYTDTLHLDLRTIAPAIAGPKRPQDRINLSDAKSAFQNFITEQFDTPDAQDKIQSSETPCGTSTLKHGDVVIAAITSCTNTSNPAVMLAAGLVAQKANALGLKTKPWVKTSLAPGSQVVTDYLTKANLLADLDALGFNLVGYGCTTCIGNSGPLPETVDEAITQGDLTVCAVLSGNRNFEGRIHPQVKNAYLASPPLVVAYALAGTMNIDLFNDVIGQGHNGPVTLKDIWPTTAEINAAIETSVNAQMFQSRYAEVFDGDKAWQSLPIPAGNVYDWDGDSTYVKHPPYFEGMGTNPAPIQDIQGARLLALLGDSVTTDHISPAGSIAPDSPAGEYLQSKGIPPKAFNSYGSRRGNHEVMMRGTFANIRLRNLLAPGTEGGWTTHQPSGQVMRLYDAAMSYQSNNTPLLVIAGHEYGTGSSRDWAAKGTRLLGVRAVIAKSFERIHRSNLIGMGVLPLQFEDNCGPETYGLTGEETFDIALESLTPQGRLSVTAHQHDKPVQFEVLVRIDTPKELEYYQHGGILHYVLRQLANT